MIRTFVFTTFLSFLCLTCAAQIDFSTRNTHSGAIIDEMDSAIKAGRYQNITSVLVARNGKLVLEKYYYGNDSTSTHNTRSGTKTIATFLTGIAIDQGYINSEKDLIFDYLQHKMPVKNPDPRKDSTTIEDLLTMSSVFECNDWNQFSRGNEERMYIIEDWTKFLLDLPVRSYPFGPQPADQPYGRAFSYGSAKAAAVAEIVQTAVGVPADKYLIEHLLNPLAIKHYKLHYSPMDILNTAGGSEYRSRDLLKLAQLCLNDGVWYEQQIISSAWLQQAITPKANAYDDYDYGYFFWLSKFGRDKRYSAFYMSGNGGNKVMAIPELDIAIVITSTNYGNRKAHGYSEEIINKYILPALTN